RRESPDPRPAARTPAEGSDQRRFPVPAAARECYRSPRPRRWATRASRRASSSWLTALLLQKFAALIVFHRLAALPRFSQQVRPGTEIAQVVGLQFHCPSNLRLGIRKTSHAPVGKRQAHSDRGRLGIL